MSGDNTRTYERASSIVFFKTKEAYGGLSNMAGGYPLLVNGIRIRSSEALYQACRFPHMPEVQQLIIREKSPRAAKMCSKPYRANSRADWEQVKVAVMRWCLRVKLAQHWDRFGGLLLETGDLPIVEQSYKDAYWGARPVEQDSLQGMNVLGRLLMELRETLKSGDWSSLLLVQPPAIPDLLLDSQPIGTVSAPDKDRLPGLEPVAAQRLQMNENVQSYQATLLDSATHEEDKPSTKTTTDQKDRLEPYPMYKDSGVPWLGEVPAHWEVVRSRRLFYVRKDLARPDDVQLAATQAYGVIPQEQFEELVGRRVTKITMHLDKRKHVEKDDFVISMRSFEGGLERAWASGAIRSSYVVLKPQPGAEVGFFTYVFKSYGYIRALQATADFIRDGQDLTYDNFRMVDLPLPPLTEQRAIVRYLDHVDRRVRRYVRAKQKLIKLLEEQKQAIIHRAVTRGLDPDVPLKPSGVEWLGDVPAHWEVKRLRTLVRSIDQGKSPQAEAILADEHSWGVLKAGCVNYGMFRDTEHKRLPLDYVLDERFIVRVGDVLVSRASGSSKLVGSVGRVLSLNYNLVLSDKTFRLNFVNRLLSDFYVYVMNSSYYRIQTENAISGAEGLANNLPLPELRDFRIAVPPQAEAIMIAEQLSRELRQLNRATETAVSFIHLLREYRTRLIADVVTGKVDVREAAAGLPDEIEDAEVPDETAPDETDADSEDSSDEDAQGE